MLPLVWLDWAKAMSKLDEDTAKLVRSAGGLDVPMFSERRGGNQSGMIQRRPGSLSPIYEPSSSMSRCTVT
jgi:hypothetical protein